jgi:hypothetical protein
MLEINLLKKICNKCKCLKSFDFYHKCSRVHDKKKAVCKKCLAIKNVIYYKNLSDDRKRDINKKRIEWENRNPEKRKEYKRKTNLKHHDKYSPGNVKRAKKWRVENRKKYNWLLRERNKLHINNISDWYVKANLITHRKLKTHEITPEMIELKRQQIIAVRLLKQLKQWRKEHESDCGTISTEQHKDEAVNEGNRWGKQARHGCDCSCTK